MSEVAIILGSARSDGNTREVVNQLLLSFGSEAQLFDLNDYRLEYFDYDKAYSNDDHLQLSIKLFNYKYWIFATPIYWYSMSAIMKNFFDRITDLLEDNSENKSKLSDVKIGVLSCSGADNVPSFFAEPFKLSADYLGMEYIGHTHAWTDRSSIVKPHAQANIDEFVNMVNDHIKSKKKIPLTK